ncbi:hypothetical protein [Flavobacterium aciduliphilum]|uniref:Lipoprotein n=1 Tax=Flavobacterium aciduliphilum TaxID=1101402 RepID=A0A328YIK2_9FLAO|nr:hypothetical protein [Flavobacterium aciduliphilum]RAR72555.1 hypothetical protein CLV55_105125 [Flavobacterium aciduliphilum]
MKRVILILFSAFLVTSCSVSSSSIKEPNNLVEFNKNDFEFTDQISATTKINFLFGFPLSDTKKIGRFSKNSIQIIGFRTKLDKAEDVAIYKLLKEHPGYDVVFYPKFETKSSGFIFTNAEVTVTARLAKLKK